MRDAAPQAIHLKDYTPPAFLVSHVELDVDIVDGRATVRSTLKVARNPAHPVPGAPLVLDGEDLELVSVAIDGRALAAAEYRLDEASLAIPNAPEAFCLEAVVRFDPWKNTKLEGLYATKAGLVTQCEAQGFRHITYFIDRPDVMARYAVTLCADKARFPRLLANGNLVAAGEGQPQEWFAAGSATARHWARWEDPFPKPCYLFAMVAAELDLLEDRFLTRSGKNALLQIYVEPGKLDQAGFAMQALKKCMRWDEEVFGLELDLERFMIVAVSDFNAGAMENKGLNIFNTRYILARADTATDLDYLNIDRVVAHEYFHNWTGNRVTCRDWFQLSLKEGLTVFRDQEYGADTYSRAVTRIQEVRSLRANQFPEDAGPMKHPVRPQSYLEIRNFYTMTVYEKGAEVVRMQHTLLGEEKFQAGMRLYFQRHDGQAVTTDDFVQAMQDASGVDLGQFKRWYDVAGTPVLDCSGEYENGRFVLTVKQSMNPPFHIPFAVKIGEHESVLSVRKPEERFEFRVKEKPVPSLLRGFSAPVTLDYPYTEADLLHLLARDDDPFNRWEAGQRLAANIILEQHGKPSPAFVEAARAVLRDPDPAFVAEALSLPAESFLAEQVAVVDPDRLHESRNALRRALAQAMENEWREIYQRLESKGPYSPDAKSIGRRTLRNLALNYLGELGNSKLAYEQFQRADNMTDAMAALAVLANLDVPERDPALAEFYARWKDEPLVADKWLSVQASSRLPTTLGTVRKLLKHPAFDLKVPNRVYALIRTFAANHVRFHGADGGGYALLADAVIALNAINPQVAARMARAFDRWRKFDSARQARARKELERIRDSEKLSKDVAEIVGKALA